MMGERFMRLPVHFSIGAFALALSVSSFSAELTPASPSTDTVALEVNNQWNVSISNRAELENPVYVTLRPAGNHWEIDGLFDAAPELERTEDLELFVATRDLQQWANAYIDLRQDCDTFEMRESDFHSVCTSRFAEKKTGIAIARVFFGTGGKIPTGYSSEKVKAAINSIPVQQAVEKLTAYEQVSDETQKNRRMLHILKSMPSGY
ncbi:hypothetical protein [Paraburkholderia susongensis]|uniref:Uncharacterized protein n=1 Tax=Paraburkholderia susongensis TaxID=1515439 RepID=A0A1X7JK23_9BURK|nr:hypothetical protein [Paraburkholderia susongensis]SMG28253.1 hypothetical protein SAMN06265784_102740 [Paraburkholderia susongensis]